MRIVINKDFREIIKRLALLLIIRYFYVMLALQVLPVEVYSYSSSGGFDINFNSAKEELSVALFLLFSILFLRLKQNNHFNYYLNVILFLIYYIPINVAFSVNNRDYGFCILTHLFYLLLMILVSRNTRILDNNHIDKHKIRYTYIRLFFMTISILMVVYKIYISGFSFNLGFDSNMIYENRANYVNNLNNSAVAYLFRLIVVNGSTFIAPLYLYLSLKNKWYLDIGLSFMCLLARYFLTYEKLIVFLPLIVVLSYIGFEKIKLDIIKIVFRVATLGLIVLEIIYKIYHNSTIYYLIVRRVMFLPAWLNGIYYDFFKSGIKIWFSQDVVFLETIIPDTYPQTPLQLISRYYFGGQMSSPNSGLFAEAFMHAGILGVVLFPFILYWIFRYIEKTFRPFGAGIEFVVAIILSLSITNQPILSRGAFFSILVPTIVIRILSQQDFNSSKNSSLLYSARENSMNFDKQRN